MYAQPYPIAYYGQNYGIEKEKDKKGAKKENFLDRAITKIIDKVISKVQKAVPKIFQELLGLNFDSSYGNYGTDVGYGEGYDSHGINSYQKPGLLGMIPMFLLKVLSNFSYFVNILKKNKFLKTFLIPALIVLGVSGMVVFLIWWLQPEDGLYPKELEYLDQESYDTSNSYGSYKNIYNDRFSNNGVPNYNKNRNDVGQNNQQKPMRNKQFYQRYYKNVMPREMYVPADYTQNNNYVKDYNKR